MDASNTLSLARRARLVLPVRDGSFALLSAGRGKSGNFAVVDPLTEVST